MNVSNNQQAGQEAGTAGVGYAVYASALLKSRINRLRAAVDMAAGGRYAVHKPCNRSPAVLPLEEQLQQRSGGGGGSGG